MNKEVKRLSINFEVARITKEDDKIEFLIVDDEMNGMIEVNYQQFKQTIIELSYVCLTSWDKKLKDEYIDFIEYFSKL